METTITNLMIIAKMSDNKRYILAIDKDTAIKILELIIEKEGVINIFDEEIEILDFRKETINGKKR